MVYSSLAFGQLLLGGILAFVCAFFGMKWLIRREQKHHIYQTIKDDIVPTHHRKQKTATMGGIALIVAICLSFLVVGFSYLKIREVQAMFILALSFFIIGVVDDYLKVHRGKGKGLSASFRFFSEIAIVLLLLLFLGYEQQSRWLVHLPLISSPLMIGWLFVPLIIFVIVGGANGVNMSDGLDGLAGGLTMMALAPFLMIALVQGQIGLALFFTCQIGALLAFLIFNFHPARIFMGDCGSLMLGSTLALGSFLVKQELLLLISGGLFVVETLSVILQVASYKTTHRRLFKMAPLHHHFEMKGVMEWKVVMAFYIVGFLLSILATMVGVMA